MKSSKGFTLIELLVVIAIIGILSSVVLASLSNARSQGQDAAIKGTMAQFGAQAELFYTTNNNSYAAFFAQPASSNGGLSLITDIESKNGSASSTWVATSGGYYIHTPLSTGTFCADPEGTTATTAATVIINGRCAR